MITHLYYNNAVGQLVIAYKIVAKNSSETDQYNLTAQNATEIQTLLQTKTPGVKYALIFGFQAESPSDAAQQQLLKQPVFFA